MSAAVPPLKIGIIGAGFSGTAVAALLHRFIDVPLEIILFDKSGLFGVGDAYRTPFPFHLLNAKAGDMSAFEDEPLHFVNWLASNAAQEEVATTALDDQFVSRTLYGKYLRSLLDAITHDGAQRTLLRFDVAAVVDAIPQGNQVRLQLNDARQIAVDKVILALGNGAPCDFPFPVASDVRCLANPWDYVAPQQVAQREPVLIVGTGLSMMDTVLTLHHQGHQGKIYAISRRGLLPLAHAAPQAPAFSLQAPLPAELRLLLTSLRAQIAKHGEHGGDWRSAIQLLRAQLPMLWNRASEADKKRFLRHLLPYWNIHRHRVHQSIAALLQTLQQQKQLHILRGEVRRVSANQAEIQTRHSQVQTVVPVQWLLNCMGPPLAVETKQQPLLQSLLKQGIAVMDTLQLGLAVSAQGALKNAAGEVSTVFYTLGALQKGAVFEAVAVPEIRRQCAKVVENLLSSLRCHPDDNLCSG